MKLLFNILLTFSVFSTVLINDALTNDVPVKKKSIKKHSLSHGKAPKSDYVAPVSVVSLSLYDAMRKAQETNPEIMAYDAAREAASYRVEQAKGLRLPTIDIKAGVGKEYTRQKYATNSINRSSVEGSVNDSRFDPSVSLRQPLFDGFDSGNKINKAKLETEQAELKKSEIMELVAFRAADSYIKVRRFKRLIDIANDNLKTIRETIGFIEQQISAGKATIVDRETAKARLEDALTAVRDIEGDYETAIAEFIETVGTEPSNLQSAEIRRELIPTSIDEGIRLAQENNRSLMLAKATKDVAKTEIEISKTPMYPKVNLEVDATKRHHVGAKPGAEDNFTALIVARFNVFNGGQDVARTKEMRAKALQAHYIMAKEKRNSEKEVRISAGEMKSAYGQMTTLRKSVKAKLAIAQSYKEQFNSGRRTLLEILDAIYDHFLSHGSKITAEASYDLSCVRYLAATGMLTKVMLNKQLPKYIEITDKED